MAKIPITRLDFDGNIQLHEVPAFRGAVVEQIGRGEELFHNHDNSTKGGFLHFRYPLVQYKCIRRRPTILLLGDATQKLPQLLAVPDWKVTFTREKRNASLFQIRRKEVEVGLPNNKPPDTLYSYHISHWLALNQVNIQRYRSAIGLVQQIELLESVLNGHLLQFFKGINVSLDIPIDVYITALNGIDQVPFKGVKMQAFHISFKANILLPSFIGLGKGVARGFGVLERQ